MFVWFYVCQSFTFNLSYPYIWSEFLETAWCCIIGYLLNPLCKSLSVAFIDILRPYTYHGWGVRAYVWHSLLIFCLLPTFPILLFLFSYFFYGSLEHIFRISPWFMYVVECMTLYDFLSGCSRYCSKPISQPTDIDLLPIRVKCDALFPFRFFMLFI